MIVDDRVEKAIKFYRDNAKQHGQLRGAISWYEYKLKRAKAAAFTEVQGTVAEREALAILDPMVEQAAMDLKEMIEQEQEMRDLLKAADLTIEVWRTQQANNRGGHV